MSAKVTPARTTPRRYQLTKEAGGVVGSGHPWVFRSHLSSAVQAFADGQWLSLVDGRNRVVGFGVYQAEGAIGIRVLARGAERPTAATFQARLDQAMARREPLRAETDAIRWINGESDGLPGVIVEQVGTALVVQAYGAGLDGLARWAGRQVAARLDLATVIDRPPHRRVGTSAAPARVLRGDRPSVVRVREGDLAFAVDLTGGQKSGAFLDLRGLRRWVRAQPLAGASVLNLFAYTGMLGLAAERAGASHVLNVDASAAALAWGAAHHAIDRDRYQALEADVFGWLPTQPPAAHQLVIVDPPSMTSRADQVPKALAAYRALYRAARTQVAPGGVLVAACCTSRIGRLAFRNTVGPALGPEFVLAHELPPEVDHPVGFDQADYLKVLIWRRAAGA